ncbi:hypothetical protein ACVWYF_004548 [Hymenobacter sp. UYAg731]
MALRRAEVRLGLSHHIAYYNAGRRHSTLGYHSSNHFETHLQTTSQLCPAWLDHLRQFFVLLSVPNALAWRQGLPRQSPPRFCFPFFYCLLRLENFNTDRVLLSSFSYYAYAG